MEEKPRNALPVSIGDAFAAALIAVSRSSEVLYLMEIVPLESPAHLASLSGREPPYDGA